MIFKILLLLTLVTTLEVANTPAKPESEPFKSRAVQNFRCNCLFNEYMHHEFELGLFYLNASNHMFHDLVALKGFGKMFEKFWRDQLEQFNLIRKYIIKRGGFVHLKKYKLHHVNHDFFANETLLLERVLALEKNLNVKLLELHNCSSNLKEYELKCRETNKRYFKHLPLSEQSYIDPHAASFLDENFTGQKVEKIKHLAHLYQRVKRFDTHLVHADHSTTHLGLNQLGVHLVDKELEEYYN